jgi:hypothetical protein
VLTVLICRPFSVICPWPLMMVWVAKTCEHFSISRRLKVALKLTFDILAYHGPGNWYKG